MTKPKPGLTPRQRRYIREALRDAVIAKSDMETAREERDDAVLLAFVHHATIKEISDTLAMSRRAIYNILANAGIPFSIAP